MSRIIKIAKVLRNNWKKSTVGFGLLTYGGSYLVERYKLFVMMRDYCTEAKTYGEKTLYQMTKPKHVTVILNPEANDKKSRAQFEKFAAPLLHLAGLKVSVVLTENQKQAQHLMQIMTNTDAVLIAGGDGTLHEAVTGFFRRPSVKEEHLPLGIVPLGKTNTVASHLFGVKASCHAQLMAEAVMAVIRETTVKLDCLKIQFEDEEQPVYGMVEFEEGNFAEVEPLVQKYWYLGALKEKYTYFKNSLKAWPLIQNQELKYVAPCSGCSKCYIPSNIKANSPHESRWWHVFVPKQTITTPAVDQNVLRRINDECGTQIDLLPEYGNITVSTSAAFPRDEDKSGTMWIKMFPNNLTWRDFFQSGLSHRKSKVKDNSGLAHTVEARQLTRTKAIPEKDESFASLVSADPINGAEIAESQTDSHLETENTENSQTQSGEHNDGSDPPTNHTEESSSPVPKSEKGEDDEESYSYIDKEKYRRTSYSIFLLPKHVTVFA